MRIIPAHVILASLLFVSSACQTVSVPNMSEDVSPVPSQPGVPDLEKLDPVFGQMVYVPAYSHIHHRGPDHAFDLTTTLSIQNTDLTSPITVTSVGYYDADGKLVRQYLHRELTLAPLGSTYFVVPESDRTGGVGANFIVEWNADQKVSQPVIESVMISTRQQQGLSFISPGRVIKTY